MKILKYLNSWNNSCYRNWKRMIMRSVKIINVWNWFIISQGGGILCMKLLI